MREVKSLGITKACFEDQAQLDDWEIFGQATWRIEGRVLICEGLGGLGGTIVSEKDKR